MNVPSWMILLEVALLLPVFLVVGVLLLVYCRSTTGWWTAWLQQKRVIETAQYPSPAKKELSEKEPSDMHPEKRPAVLARGSHRLLEN